MSGKAQWHTPLNVLKNKEEVWSKIEQRSWSPPKVDTSSPITYFNNDKLQLQEAAAEYDLFFSYTKIFPLWDQKKPKDNCRNLADIRENIYQQEKIKPVPALTSFTYGMATRVPLDLDDACFRRSHAMADFKRRRGVVNTEDKEL